MFHQLNFKPFEYQFKFRKHLQKTYIFDRVRKKYILLTPEEWVRQHVITFLIEHKGVSPGLISVEKGVQYNKLSKRFDLKVFDSQAGLDLLVECKAPKIKLTEETFLQSLTYSQEQHPRLIMRTNGIQHIYYDTATRLVLEDFSLI